MRVFLAFVVLSLVAAPAAAEGPYFYVVNSSTRMMAEVLAHRTDDGAPVVLWPHYGGASQQFLVERKELVYLQPRNEQWFLLRARHSNKCLKAFGDQSGAPVRQSECSADASQLWRVRTVAMTAAECSNPNQCFGGNRHVLENYYDRGRRCLDAANGAFPAPPAQGAGLQAWDCISKFSAPNAVNQEWELIDTRNWGAPGPIVR